MYSWKQVLVSAGYRTLINIEDPAVATGISFWHY